MPGAPPQRKPYSQESRHDSPRKVYANYKSLCLTQIITMSTTVQVGSDRQGICHHLLLCLRYYSSTTFDSYSLSKQLKPQTFLIIAAKLYHLLCIYTTSFSNLNAGLSSTPIEFHPIGLSSF